MDLGHRDITLFELEILRDLGQHPSLRSLGRSKGLEAPHLSKIIHRLEKKLKLSVVKRSPKGFLLTPDGIRLVKQARDILGLAEGLTQSKNVSPAPVPTLTVAATRFVAAFVLAPSLVQMRRAGLAGHFRLIDMAPDELAEAAVLAACEVVVTVGVPPLTRAWESVVIGKMGWGCFASRRHPLASRVSPNEALEYPFVVPAYWKSGRFETGNDYCPVAWSARRRGDESSSILTAIEIARLSSDQLLFAPRVAVQRHIAGGELREIWVAGWDVVEKEVVLSVKSDVIPKRLERSLVSALRSQLE